MAYRRRRASSAGLGCLLLGIVILGVIGLGRAVVQAITQFWATDAGTAIILAAVALLIFAGMWRYRKSAQRRRRLNEEIRKVQISDNRADYIITNDDYRRGNAKEHLYRKLFQLSLFNLYDNQCAKCHRRDNGVDLDHFFLSKNEGACFIMRHRLGYIVNNAVLLCQSCNRSKSDATYKQFYSKEEILGLFQKNAQMTQMLNRTPILDSAGNPINPIGRSR